MSKNDIMRPFINLAEVVKTYEGNGKVYSALKGVTLSISEGEYVGIVGRSGSGKTTLLNMLTGIDKPTSGEISAAGRVLNSLTEDQLAVWRGRKVGIVFQFFQLLPTLTILENVMLPMDFCGVIPPKQRKERAVKLLEKVGIAEHANKLPAALSGGEQQRAAIARALSNDPPIIAADEPTGNLDSKTAEMVFAIFDNLSQEGKTILIISHDKDISRRVQRTITITDGIISGDISYGREVMQNVQPQS
ncbi:MAG: ABC transporter ATP-binding protein [Bacillota bacterium]|nr:ABC transporter ATP-binding protein [Bacillota bacterium]